MTTIEDIILRDDQRGISAMRSYLSSNFITEAAEVTTQYIDYVGITTGFYISSAGTVETDGPPGAAAIAYSIQKLGGKPLLVTDRYAMKTVNAIADGYSVIEFPITSHFESMKFANEILHSNSISSLLSIERAGFSNDGTYRNMRNGDITPYTAKIDHLFDQHPNSVGIGDGGNEIGMGNLYKPMLKHPNIHSNPCVTTVSKLIIASCSNWGGYGMIAAMSLISGRNLLPTPKMVEEWVIECVSAGAVDGFSGENKNFVDGKPVSSDMECIDMLHSVLKSHGVSNT